MYSRRRGEEINNEINQEKSLKLKKTNFQVERAHHVPRSTYKIGPTNTHTCETSEP